MEILSHFRTIEELTKTLSREQGLLSEMFEKRKLMKYPQGLALDADYQKMNAIIEKHRNWVVEKVQWACGDFRQLLTNEWKKTRDRYKEYDGTYLGHYTQYIFWFFCIFGIFIFLLVIFLSLDAHYHWTKR